MKVANSNKYICCVLASILLFLGIGVALSANGSFVLRAEKTNLSTQTSIRSAEQNLGESVVCTLSMLNDGSSILRINTVGSVTRWQNREILSFIVVGVSFLYLFYYQSAECKEDGQLFLCRSAIVDYIHLKDSGE